MKIVGQVELGNLSVKGSNVVWNTPANLGTYDTHGASEGVPVPISLSASGPTTVTYSIVSGSLPSALHMGANGVLTGDAKTVGAFPFTVRATAGPFTADRAFTLTIINTAGGDIGN